MANARIADAADLCALLALFAASDVSGHAEPRERAEQIWSKTLAREGLFVFVSDADSRIVSSCMLITVPNLLRGGRQHRDSRKRRDASAFSGPRAWPCGSERCPGRSVENGLPPRPDAKRSSRPCGASLL